MIETKVKSIYSFRFGFFNCTLKNHSYIYHALYKALKNEINSKGGFHKITLSFRE